MQAEPGTAEWRLMHERMARVEVETKHTAEVIAELRTHLQNLETQLDRVAADVQSAKTALRIGLWFSSTGAAALGWAGSQIWGK